LIRKKPREHRPHPPDAQRHIREWLGRMIGDQPHPGLHAGALAGSRRPGRANHDTNTGSANEHPDGRNARQGPDEVDGHPTANRTHGTLSGKELEKEERAENGENRGCARIAEECGIGLAHVDH